MKDCPKWANWVLLIAGILYVVGDLTTIGGSWANLWGINVWHLLLLIFGIVKVTN
jgi:hypothetical protein